MDQKPYQRHGEVSPYLMRPLRSLAEVLASRATHGSPADYAAFGRVRTRSNVVPFPVRPKVNADAPKSST